MEIFVPCAVMLSCFISSSHEIHENLNPSRLNTDIVLCIIVIPSDYLSTLSLGMVSIDHVAQPNNEVLDHFFIQICCIVSLLVYI